MQIHTISAELETLRTEVFVLDFLLSMNPVRCCGMLAYILGTVTVSSVPRPVRALTISATVVCIFATGADEQRHTITFAPTAVCTTLPSVKLLLAER